MRLATIDPQQLGRWLVQTLTRPGIPVELHVDPDGYELRCADAEPFRVKADP